VACQGSFTAANKACRQVSLIILHAGLGHTSLSKMKYISECKDVILDTFLMRFVFLAKAHRLPFTRSTISTTKPFELIHMDLWGPYRVANLDGAKFFITIVDDYSRNTWTQLLQHKTQVYAALE